MQTKRKVILTVVMIVLTALFVGLSVFSVLAAEKQNVETAITVNYNAPSIDAKVCATYAVDGGEEDYLTPSAGVASDSEVSGDYLIFKGESTSKNAGSLSLSGNVDFTKSVVLKCTFENTSNKLAFKVSLTVSNTGNENVTLLYSKDGTSYDSAAPSNQTIATETTKHFYIKATPSNVSIPAKFTPIFNWKIEK